jgi:hypothetical protein
VRSAQHLARPARVPRNAKKAPHDGGAFSRSKCRENYAKTRNHEGTLSAPPQPIAAPLLFAADFSGVLLNQRDLKLPIGQRNCPVCW